MIICKKTNKAQTRKPTYQLNYKINNLPLVYDKKNHVNAKFYHLTFTKTLYFTGGINMCLFFGKKGTQCHSL